MNHRGDVLTVYRLANQLEFKGDAGQAYLRDVA